MNTYAAHIKHDTVTQVIVGNAAWAVEHLGGEWVDSPVKVGIGWLLVDGEITPPPVEPDDVTD
jgi:hypothetical protein